MDSVQDSLLEEIKKVAPGTALREAIDNIINARTGALIVVGDGPNVMELVEGGVRLDSEFSPSLLYEVAKMDGAIILDRSLTRVSCVNAHLWPKKDIPSQERGVRHKIAQRTAIQTGEMVIAISQRRNVVTIYKDTHKYVLRDISFVLSKANQALQTLSNYRSSLDQALKNLDKLELERMSYLGDAVLVIRRMEMIWRVATVIEGYILELGIEGRLVKMQLEEILGDAYRQHCLLIRDYARVNHEPEQIIQAYRGGGKEMPSATSIATALGFESGPDYLNIPVHPRGFRLLKRIPRLPSYAIDNLIESMGHLGNIVTATLEQLDEVEGIGEARAKAIAEGLARLEREARLESAYRS